MPLAEGECSSEDARRLICGKQPRQLFPDSAAPEAAYSGLLLYFSCYDECHRAAQELHTPEGSFWHAILHRQEPDPGNAAYWFSRTGKHPVFPQLHEAASEIHTRHEGARPISLADEWDPFAFIDYCEHARKHPGSREELYAREVQRAEWQLLFDYCARPRT
ncbi:MAG: hypothetical protein HYS04_04515 [Acidobacteria bacterium]|nr:hypothetical protein [Acidobacteriota bacterium]